ncbi:MAG: universal stress protein [Candidatus Korobacteraceae bacterium]|jgi:nucleotide-binding universal stress UspA family protein
MAAICVLEKKVDVADGAMPSSPAMQIAIRNILVATDFTSASFKPSRYAIGLARWYGSKLYLVHVVEHPRFAPHGSHPIDEAVVVALEEGETLERQLTKLAPLAAIDHALIVKDGEVCEEVLGTVSSEAVDLVVIGTHGRTGIKKLVLGSTAEKIFRNALCPVLTVGPNVRIPRSPGAEPTHILVPTDFSPASRFALQYARFITRQHNAKLTLLNVLDGPITSDVQQLLRSSRAGLRDFAAEEGLLTFGPELVTRAGLVVKTILSFARKEHVDLIVLGVRSAAGLKDHAMWPNAYRIVCGAPCPVLTVRDHQV